jgi:ketosteroid isomerase-like protein
MSALPIPTETATETAALAWLTGFYAKVDSLDIDGVMAGFTPDAVMQFGADDPVSGHDAIRGGLNGLFSILDSMKHAIHRVWISTDTTLMEATVTYYMTGGRQVPIPVVTILERRDELIADIRIFIDRVPMTA